MKTSIYMIILLVVSECAFLQKHSLQQKVFHKYKINITETEQYQVCRFRSGKLGYVTQLKQSDNKDEPVTIVSKKSYAEIDRNTFRVYDDQSKQDNKCRLELSAFKRIIFPQSFSQDDSQIFCFQIEIDQDYKGNLFSDYEVSEPLIKDNIYTLCFNDSDEMKKWEMTMYAFKEDCYKNEKLNQLQNQQYLQKVEEHFEQQLTNLIDAGKGIYEQFQKVQSKNKDIEANINKIYQYNRTEEQKQRLRQINVDTNKVSNEDNKSTSDENSQAIGPQAPKVISEPKKEEKVEQQTTQE